jgi:hypothetical protein
MSTISLIGPSAWNTSAMDQVDTPDELLTLIDPPSITPREAHARQRFCVRRCAELRARGEDPAVPGRTVQRALKERSRRPNPERTLA